MKTDSLRIATEYYYWKPANALFNSFGLEEYARAGTYLEHPVLDLGCGDGTFGAMLRQRGIVDFVDVAVDFSVKGLRQAKKNALYGALQADARALPFKSETINSVFANLVLGAIRTDVDQAILEIYRVLANRGSFVLTVPTSRVGQTLVVPRILRKVGLSLLAMRFMAKSIRRLEIYNMFDEEVWLKKLEEAHFRVERLHYFFTPRQAFWGTLLAFQFFRVFGFLKILKVGSVKQYAACIQEKIFRSIFMKEQSLTDVHKRGRAGYLLVVARKY